METLTAAKLASSSRVEMVQHVMPSDANTLGTAFGGRIVQWMDLCAAVAARRHARMPVVTAAIDELTFQAPLRIGWVVVLRARVNAVFGSSMEVEVEAIAENPDTGDRRPCCVAFLTFVALGPDQKPAKAPLLLTETEEEAARVRDAAERRTRRLAGRDRAR